MKNAYEEAGKKDWDREDRYQKEYCSLNSIYLMVLEEQHYNSPTPFDDTFRTECVRMTEWMIPLINEVYGTTYNEHSMIRLHENEQMLYELSISGEMPEIYVRDLVELTQTVLKQITRKLNDDERERIVKSMGGRVLEMESDRILERGRQEGRLEGRIEGIQEIILRAIGSLRENYSSDEVPIQLKKLFGLTDEEAARYMKM